MISKKNLPLAISTAILIIGAVVFCVAFFREPVIVETGMETVRVYFKNPSAYAVEYEERIVASQDNAAMASAALNMFFEGPKNQILVKTLPESVTVLDQPLIVNDAGTNIFEINFGGYNDMPPIDEAFFRASLVWTMTGLGFIHGVKIYADGEELKRSNGRPMGIQNRDSIDINPVISPNRIVSKRVKLYFSNEAGTKLLYEWRDIEVDPSKTEARYIVDEIIKGPKSGERFATVSSDVKILSVETENGICFVNLSADFMTKMPPSNASAQVSVYSIVNSLMEMKLVKVKKVQFLIDSQTVTQLKGEVDLSRQFERGASIIEDEGE